MKIVLLVGDDNQIYQVLTSKDKPMRTLTDSRTGVMTFTSLETDSGKRP